MCVITWNSVLMSSLQVASTPCALLRETLCFLCAGVFLSGGSATGRETAQMALTSRCFARSATAGLDSSSARTATAPAHISCAMLTKIALMAQTRTRFSVVCSVTVFGPLL